MPSFTKRAIKETFIKLLNEKPLAQITVKDIVQECGINRNSFYYHYEDLPSLIEEIMVEEADRLVEEYPFVESIEECFDAAIEFTLNNKRAIFHVYNSINRDIFERYLMKICDYLITSYVNTAFADLGISKSDKMFVIRYHKWLYFGAIIEWLEKGMKEDIKGDVSRLCLLSKKIIDDIVSGNIEK